MNRDQTPSRKAEGLRLFLHIEMEESSVFRVDFLTLADDVSAKDFHAALLFTGFHDGPPIFTGEPSPLKPARDIMRGLGGMRTFCHILERMWVQFVTALLPWL